MDAGERMREILSTHPCYNEEAHKKYARMHVPVAPKCNIQCNYCNRKYDCCNESRPGVTSEVLTPAQAIKKIGIVKEKIPNLKVIGIAGPGDPLANEETFQTLELLRKTYPELTACVSTNGLALPASAERLYSLGIRFVTVTMNASDAGTGAEIYRSVLWEGKRYAGREGAAILLEKQSEGIGICSRLGMLVKVNIVMIPGINDKIIPELVKKVKSLGAYIVNILPLIPVPGTVFENRSGPTPLERKKLMDVCSLDAKMMRHCKQCRADAVGLLGEDRSSEFAGCGLGKCDGCGPRGNVPNMVSFDPEKGFTVGIASDGKTEADAGFGNAKHFVIYSVNGSGTAFLRETGPNDLGKATVGSSHREHIENLVDLLDDCDIIVAKEIGHMPRTVIENRGKKVVTASGPVEKVLAALRRLSRVHARVPPYISE